MRHSRMWQLAKPASSHRRRTLRGTGSQKSPPTSPQHPLGQVPIRRLMPQHRLFLRSCRSRLTPSWRITPRRFRCRTSRVPLPRILPTRAAHQRRAPRTAPTPVRRSHPAMGRMVRRTTARITVSPATVRTPPRGTGRIRQAPATGMTRKANPAPSRRTRRRGRPRQASSPQPISPSRARGKVPD